MEIKLMHDKVLRLAENRDGSITIQLCLPMVIARVGSVTATLTKMERRALKAAL